MPEQRRSPYPGLQPFFVEDEAFFIGRARDVRLIVASLFASPLTLLYGPSGVGKSSVLHAGVLPRLGERRNVVVVSVRDWSDDPLRSIGEAAARVAGTAYDGDLGAVLEACSGDALRRVMLILDQFEHALAEREVDDDLVDGLSAALLRPGLRVSALIAIREDSIAQLDRFDGRLPGLFDTVLRVEYLDRDAGADAIRRPLAAWEQATGEHMEVEDALVEAVLDAVPAGRATGGIETAQLQLVMARVWDAERAAGSSVLREHTFHDLGGATGIVRSQVRDALDAMPGADRDLAAVVLDRLVTPSGARIAHLADDLAEYAGRDAATLRPLLERLATARVLRPVAAAGTGGARFEVYHELLADAVLAWLTDHEADRRAAAANASLRRRVASLAAAVVCALVVAIVLVAALVAEQRSSETARSQATSATARRLLSSGADPMLALALARRATKTRPTRDAEITLRAALTHALERAVFPIPGKGVLSVEFSRDGRALLTVQADGSVRVQDRASGRPRRTLRADGVSVARFCPDGEHLAVAGDGGASLLAGSRRLRLTRDPVEGISCSVDGARVAIRVDDRVRFFDGRTGRADASLVAPSGEADPTQGVALSPDGRRVAVAVAGGALVMRVRGNRPTRMLRSANGADVVSVAFGSDGRRVVTGAFDGAVGVWDRASSLTDLRGNASFVSSVALAPDGTLAVSTAADGTARVWDVASGLVLAELVGHDGAPTSAAFAPDGRTIATSGDDGTVRVWRLPIAGVLRAGSDLADGTFSRDGRRVAIATTGGTIDVLDAATRRRTARIVARGVARLAVAPDGSGIVAREADGTVRAWSLARRREPVTIARLQDEVLDVDYSPDGRAVALATGAGTVRLVDLSGRLLREFRDASAGPLVAIAFSPDGRSIAAGDSQSNAIVVVDRRSGRRLRRIPVDEGGPYSVAFSPDGARLITGGDGGAAIRDLATGRLLRRLGGHRSTVKSVSYDARGELVATADEDGATRLWEARSGELLTTFAGRVASFGGEAFVLAVGSRVARLHPCDACGSLKALESRGRARSTRTFTHTQLAPYIGE